MKTVLLTGASGFVGRHFARELRAAGLMPVGLDIHESGDALPLVRGSVENAEDLSAAFDRFKPDAVVHLAGLSSVPRAEAEPERTFRVNVEGTLRLMEILRRRHPSVRILFVSTAQVYGGCPQGEPISEEAAPEPDSIYALSKLAAEMVVSYYGVQYDMAVVIVRPVNHIGPGQSTDFVVSSFATQLAEIAAGRREAEMRVGNLDSIRDFIDVRDVVRGYRLLLERGVPGRVYNLASGRRLSVRGILERLCAVAGVHPRIVVDPARYRPADAGPRLDTTRIARDTEWRPEISIEQSLKDVYDDAVARTSRNSNAQNTD